MKTKVLISSDCGIESIPGGSIVRVLPDEIVFSPVEVYKNAKEIDFREFNLRLKYDLNANPEVKGCSEDVLKDILDDLETDGYERFYFILSSQKLSYYKPLVEKLIKENRKLQAFYYTIKTEGYPICYMAMEAQKMFDQSRSIPDVERMINFVDGNNTTYLYSPQEDKVAKIEKYSVDEEAFEIKGNSSILYFLKRNDSSIIRLKEKNKSIGPYLDALLIEMDERKVIPFVMYTNKYSEYTKAILKELGKTFVHDEVLALEMPPYMVLKYGKYSIAVGYVVKYDKEA